MKANEIRKLASDPKRGVPTAAVFGPVWEKHHPSTRKAIWRMCLSPAPYGSEHYGKCLLFTAPTAHAMAPDCKGLRLADRFNEECGGRFVRGIGLYAANWQWRPESYQDENGVPNQLVVTGDGFPMARIRLGSDDVWRWDLVQDPEVARHERTKEEFDAMPDRWKVPRAFAVDISGRSRVTEMVLRALGLPPDTDPMTLMGQPVSEDDFIRAMKVEGGRTEDF